MPWPQVRRRTKHTAVRRSVHSHCPRALSFAPKTALSGRVFAALKAIKGVVEKIKTCGECVTRRNLMRPPQQLRQFGDVRGNAPGLVAGEPPLGRHPMPAMKVRARTTLGDLQRSSPWVWLNCEKCPHHAPLACAVPVVRWRADIERQASAMRALHRLRSQRRDAPTPRLGRRAHRLCAVSGSARPLNCSSQRTEFASAINQESRAFFGSSDRFP